MRDALPATETVPAPSTAPFVRAGSAPASPPDGTGEFGRGLCLGRYVVLELLDRGGMGDVYAAYDPELDRRIALKVLRADIFDPHNGAAQRRLAREAQAVARLQHPNVVTVHDAGTVGDRFFIAMELVEGPTLGAWLKGERRSWREILRLYRAAGEGLAAAHDAGLVHRDFKPGNVMIDRHGAPRVLDFGLVRRLAGDDETPEASRRQAGLTAGRPGPLDASLTRTGHAVGTLAYMAPEQLTGDPIDARTDQFAFAVALWEAIYGERPFRGSDAPGLLTTILSGPPTRPAETRIPDWLHGVLRRALLPRPEDRYPDLRALLAALDRDPAVRRRRVVLSLAALATAGALFAATQRPPAAPALLCQGAERKLDGVWDDERRAALDTAFNGLGEPWSSETWPRVEEAFDRYAGEWVEQHTAACEATHLRGEQSAPLLDLRVSCLEQRLDDLDAAVRVLAALDSKVARRAIAMVSSLPDLGPCARRQTLLEIEPPPADPARAARIGDLRQRLAAARMLDRAERHDQAFELAAAAVIEADELGYAPLAAESRLARAQIEGGGGAAENGEGAGPMHRSLVEALGLAQTSRHDDALAEAQVLLIEAARRRGDADEARLWAEVSESALERLGLPRDLAADRLYFLGRLARDEDRYQDAIGYFEAFFELGGGRAVSEPALAHHQLALTHRALGSSAEAENHLQQAIAFMRENYGRRHPYLAAAFNLLGRSRLERGAAHEARQSFLEGLALLAGADWPDSPLAAPLRQGLEAAEEALGRAGAGT